MKTKNSDSGPTLIVSSSLPSLIPVAKKQTIHNQTCNKKLIHGSNDQTFENCHTQKNKNESIDYSASKSIHFQKSVFNHRKDSVSCSSNILNRSKTSSSLTSLSSSSESTTRMSTTAPTKIQQPNYSKSTTSSNLKIKIYHSSNSDPLNHSKIKRQSVLNLKKSFQQQHQTQSNYRETFIEKSDSNQIELNNNAHQKQLIDLLKEKESIIAEITKLIDDKEHVVQSLYIEMNEKNEKIFALQDEIRKRRHDMNEMSRKIIELDQKLKCCHCKAFLDYEWRPLTRSLSGLSLRSIGTEEKNSNPRWSRISRINKAIRKILGKHGDTNAAMSSNTVGTVGGNGDCIDELKTILQEKEMLITDLRLETKLTNTKLLELENLLRKKDEESFQMKKNNDYLEKIFKSKMID
ncbi:hypothetical protein SSS_00263 [Sarcoptes scabiei]|uniref:Uncharacterized protein n=1 Tax=Sarcoptes scabiei TaxID=52283 RepID=A0A834VGL2_SARSC|nr:hypothetical protein SSS_00263 [Sarcoptes scabiei]